MDGGTRPAYNVQFATDTSSQVIVGVEVEKLNDPGVGRKLYVPVKNEEKKRELGDG